MSNRSTRIFFLILGFIFLIGTVVSLLNFIDAVEELHEAKIKIPAEIWWAMIERLAFTIFFFVLAGTYPDHASPISYQLLYNEKSKEIGDKSIWICNECGALNQSASCFCLKCGKKREF